jgi:Peptidase M16 inactive domain
MGAPRRFRDPRPEEIEALTLEGMRSVVMGQLVPSNLEVSIVGDIDAAELEDCLLRYLGTVLQTRPQPVLNEAPVRICNPPAHIRHQTWHLKVGVFLLARRGGGGQRLALAVAYAGTQSGRQLGIPGPAAGVACEPEGVACPPAACCLNGPELSRGQE